MYSGNKNPGPPPTSFVLRASTTTKFGLGIYLLNKKELILVPVTIGLSRVRYNELLRY